MGKKPTARPLAFLISAAILSSCGSASASLQPATKLQVTSTANPAATASVPWIDKPATIPTTTAATIALTGTCKPADLKVGTATLSSATPKKVWSIPITDSGSQPCSLLGYVPDITAIGPSGNRVALSNSQMLKPDPMVVFQPRVPVYFDILFAAQCDSDGLVKPSEHYSSLELSLPRGIFDLSNISLLLCNDRIISGFMPVPPPTPAPGTVASLNTKLEIPKTVKAGSTLDYQVVLENQSNETVNLNPCPVYQEGFIHLTAPNGKSSTRVFELNCSTVHSVKPHQKITYEMVIPVPSELGAVKFGWHIVPGGPYVGTGLTIVG